VHGLFGSSDQDAEENIGSWVPLMTMPGPVSLRFLTSSLLFPNGLATTQDHWYPTLATTDLIFLTPCLFTILQDVSRLNKLATIRISKPEAAPTLAEARRMGFIEWVILDPGCCFLFQPGKQSLHDMALRIDDQASYGFESLASISTWCLVCKVWRRGFWFELLIG